ncbi:MAG: gamma carbonic anhydrase family protein [Flavobacteriales bacterium]|nr:MAG: gamma carbonic anhydrase family protein [Flavobacteriales bacterium TMED96]RZP10728.1 MAG: gamma carbonic anhydrase family protein [Flavobacteriales bacterium]|tara:strand:- start:1779 stop:2288 length:510 start_codon:yes stop_codon:yes gene_type:complete
MLIKSVLGKRPLWGKDCFFADNASIIGDIVIGDFCSIWFNTVIRGDVNKIRIGNNVNIQDGSVIHATYKKSSTSVGNYVSVGHNAIIHGCTIDDFVLIGMGSIVMDNAKISSNTIIAAGSVILENTVVEPNSVYGGIPAKKIKDINQSKSKKEIERIAKNYTIYSSWYK